MFVKYDIYTNALDFLHNTTYYGNCKHIKETLFACCMHCTLVQFAVYPRRIQ